MSIYSDLSQFKDFEGKETLDLTRYFRIQLNQHTYFWENNSFSREDGYPKLCTKEFFQTSDEQWEALSLGTYFCPDFTKNTYLVSGQWSSIISKYPNMRIMTCQQVSDNPEEECGSEEFGK